MKKAMPLIILSLLSLAWIKDLFINKHPTYKPVPLQSTITKVQPMTGIVLWTDNPQNNTDAITLEYSYLLYNDIVAKKGVYDWSPLEKKLNAAASRNHQLIIRFRFVYPGFATAVPRYIKQLPGYKETEGTSEGKVTWFPDWKHPELQRFTLEFYQKFAEKYARDPRIAFIQVGFGLWAEYHIYDGPCDIGTTFPSKIFQEKLFLHLAKYLQHTHWSISIDAHDEKYSPFKEKPQLLTLHFGLFDDSFMHKNHHVYNANAWLFFGNNRHYTSPAGGEFSYYTDFDQKNVLNKQGIHGVTFEQASKKYHITYMLGNDQPLYRSMQRIKQAGMACGYKFKILSLEASAQTAKLTITNTGVAPLYYDAYISINGVRGKDSLKNLLPGKIQELHVNAGGEQLQLNIECDRLLPKQRIGYEAHLKGKPSFFEFIEDFIKQ